MKNLLMISGAAVLVLCGSIFTPAQAGNPDFSELKPVAQLPQELPQRILGLAYDGQNLWANIYQGQGRYAKLDPLTLNWALDNEIELNRAIATVAGAFASPGGVCFVNSTLWVGGFYGQSFGSINTRTWRIEKLFEGKQREDGASQSYSSMACDGNYLWIAWHWFKYDRPRSQTQLLLKVDPESGKVIAEYAAPGGPPSDGAHALTWDGTRLWYAKDNKLSSIDPSTGAVTAQYVLESIRRPSGLAWAKEALWISEFDGRIWRLPFGK